MRPTCGITSSGVIPVVCNNNIGHSLMHLNALVDLNTCVCVAKNRFEYQEMSKTYSPVYCVDFYSCIKGRIGLNSRVRKPSACAKAPGWFWRRVGERASGHKQELKSTAHSLTARSRRCLARNTAS